ncbi:MAG: 16S rRNA (cytosine(967)-C(5))-methyltransferase RsmB [Clostridiales bacterium]|nr:16S rRNA (cytosine(967)-C(5))-methyltransferase RsmB [Clostridiales bacterium]
MFDPRKSLSAENISKLVRDKNERELCFLLLCDVIGDGAFSNLAIKKADKEAQLQGISLNFVRAMFYGTLTYLYAIDQITLRITGRDLKDLDIVSQVAIRMSFWQLVFSESDIPSYAVVSSAVDIVKKYNSRASGLVNALLRKIDSAAPELKDIDSYNPNVRTSLKPELYGILKKSYGQDKACSVGKALLSPSPTTVRFDPAKISGEDLIEDLVRFGIEAETGSFMPCALTVKGSISGIENSPAYKTGLISVQNEAAQLASYIASPSAGDKILDVCSAPGGKSCHMAEIASDDCDITSLDISSSRLELVKANAERHGLKSIRTVVADSTDLSSFEDSSYDIVLCDVPCSGLGLMGRKPDIRLNMTYEKIQDIIEVQGKILEEASHKVRPGGTLIYCTCTLNDGENEGRVKEFLKVHDDFEVCPVGKFIPSNLAVNDQRNGELSRGCVTLFPDTDKVDGFFIARMERRK